MPTTSRRRRWIPQAIACFQQQRGSAPYELIVGGDIDVEQLVPRSPSIRFVEIPDVNIGRKRNLINTHARGALIAHWDDDDWYAPWRIASQVSALIVLGTKISGHRTLVFWDAADDRFWQYQCPVEAPGACGATLLYERSLWESRPFDEQSTGEDWRWCSYHAEPVAEPLIPTCIASTHASNTCRRRYSPPWWTSVDYKPPTEAEAWLDAARLITQPIE